MGATGSSVFPELTSFAKEAITVPMNTLDSLTDVALQKLPDAASSLTGFSSDWV
jgi:hypothetical protein